MVRSSYFVDQDRPFASDMARDLTQVPPLPECAGLRLSAWAMERGDAHHRGRSDRVSAQSAHVKWAYPLQRSDGVTDFPSSPVIGPDGTVYVGNRLGEMHAVDGASGKRRWKASFGGQLVSSAAVAADGTVYFEAANRLHAVDGKTGDERWSVADAGFWGSAALTANGTVYRGFDAYEGTTGVLKWSVQPGGTIGAPAIGDDCTIYVAYGGLYAVDGATGVIKWTLPGRPLAWSTPAISADNTVYFGGGDSVLYAVDGASGKVRWQTQAHVQITTSQSIGADGTIYFGDGTDLIALDGRTGTEKWTFHAIVDGFTVLISSPVVAGDDTVYFTSQSALFAVDGATGREKWHDQVWLRSLELTSPAIGDDGTLYVIADSPGPGVIQLVALGD